MVIYDEQPRPRVLLTGVAVDSELAEVAKKHSGTSRIIEKTDSEIRLASWDALISVGKPWHYEDHLGIIQIGGEPWGTWAPQDKELSLLPPHQLKIGRSYGEEVVTNDDLDDSLKALVKSELIPLIRQSPIPRKVVDTRWSTTSHSTFTPLLSDLDGKPYGAIYQPHRGVREVIYLPDLVTDIKPWLLYAFERWSAHDPEAFPAAPDWTAAVEWMTAEEIDARDTWVAAVDAAQKARDAADRIEQESLSALTELRVKADEAERVVLTGTAEELVQAVRSALIRIGFVVEDQDALGAREKLEDLRVHDGEWIALCEVKGYTGGGKVADLLKIGRFVERYMKETKGESPNARWYVVNQFRERDPSKRKQLLWGQDADVEGFAESDGLAIDTRSIFLLDKDVAGGVITRDEARRLLRESTGRFAYGL